MLRGCGLRRAEVAQIDCKQVQHQEGRWFLVDVAGPGNRLRSVPIPQWAKATIDGWTSVAGINGGGCSGPSRRGGEVGATITAQAIYLIAKEHAERLGIP